MKKLFRRLALILTLPTILIPLLMLSLFLSMLGGLINEFIFTLVEFKEVVIDLYLNHWLKAWNND